MEKSYTRHVLSRMFLLSTFIKNGVLLLENQYQMTENKKSKKPLDCSYLFNLAQITQIK